MIQFVIMTLLTATSHLWKQWWLIFLSTGMCIFTLPDQSPCNVWRVCNRALKLTYSAGSVLLLKKTVGPVCVYLLKEVCMFWSDFLLCIGRSWQLWELAFIVTKSHIIKTIECSSGCFYVFVLFSITVSIDCY